MSILKFVVRLAVGTALVVYLLHEHDVPLDQLWQLLANVPSTALLTALVLDLGGQTLSAFRWARLAQLSGQRLSFSAAWSLYFSGMFFNTCLPTNIGGDVIRVVGFSRHTGSKSTALASVFMDRNVGMAALLTLGLASALLSGASVEATFGGVRYALPLWPLFSALLAGYVLVNVFLFKRAVYRFVRRVILPRLPERVAVKVDKLRNALNAYRQPVTVYAWPFALSLVYQASEAAWVWVLARGLGLELPFWVFGAMVLFQAVAGLLPISINNIGVRDGIFCAVLLGQAHALGRDPERIKAAAFALSLAYLGIIIFSGLTGGLVYLLAGLPRPTEAEALQALDPPDLAEAVALGKET